MAYTITKSDGTQFTIPALTVDTIHTSLSLWGRGTINWGQLEQNNFVHLLENFADNSAPLNPITGQLWYDTGVSPAVIRVCNVDSITHIATWKAVSDTSSDTEPTPATPGQIWFDRPNNLLKFWDGVKWEILSINSVSTNPVSGTIGQIIYNTTTNVLEYWDGVKWQVLNSSNAGNTPPPSGVLGQLWFNINTQQMMVFNGTAWTNIVPAVNYAVGLIF